MRNVRRDAMKHLEELVRNGDVGDDDERRAEERVQKLTDEHVAQDRRAAEAQGSRDPRSLEMPNMLTHFRASRAGTPTPEPDQPRPRARVAIIMDGNGRWAARRGLPVADGHRAGSRALRPIVETAIDLGVESLAVYAFSTENWTRSEDEVDALMDIFAETIDRELPDLVEQGVRVRFVGRRDRAPEDLQERMAKLERETKRNDRLSLWIAFDYGGRAELVEAARRLVARASTPEDVDENTFAAQLYAPAMPDPDLLIRTSGELRISNFLLWQLAYCGARLRRHALARLRAAAAARGARERTPAPPPLRRRSLRSSERCRGPTVRRSGMSNLARAARRRDRAPARPRARLARRLVAVRRSPPRSGCSRCTSSTR